MILLAVVEVFKTTVTYFSEGRVKVTFIVDTILVVMLTEIISLWFKEADQGKLLSARGDSSRRLGRFGWWRCVAHRPLEKEAEKGPSWAARNSSATSRSIWHSELTQI